MNYVNEYADGVFTSDDARMCKRNNLKWVSFRYVEKGLDSGFPYEIGKMSLDLQFEGKEGDYIIPMSGSISGYGRNEFDPNYGYASISSPSYAREWITFANFVKKGDEVVFMWVYDNNNQYMERNNLHHDELWLIVNRGKKQYSFLMGQGTCEQNTARMLRMGNFNQFAPNRV